MSQVHTSETIVLGAMHKLDSSYAEVEIAEQTLQKMIDTVVELKLDEAAVTCPIRGHEYAGLKVSVSPAGSAVLNPQDPIEVTVVDVIISGDAVHTRHYLIDVPTAEQLTYAGAESFMQVTDLPHA